MPLRRYTEKTNKLRDDSFSLILQKIFVEYRYLFLFPIPKLVKIWECTATEVNNPPNNINRKSRGLPEAKYGLF